VIRGPAKQPLCSILIEYDRANDGLYALGSFGGDISDKFFKQFGPRLEIEWGSTDAHGRVSGGVMAVPINQYSRTQMMCGA
jgi:arsenite oxidase small subunit